MKRTIARAVVLYLSAYRLPTASPFTIQARNAVPPTATTTAPSPVATGDSCSRGYGYGHGHGLRSSPGDDADATDDDGTAKRVETAWRHVKKPLLRIGGKGITAKHGNSLLELLDDHTVVKVKVNTDKLGTLEEVAALLIDCALGEGDAGVEGGVEVIQAREVENTVMLGKAGAMGLIRDGSFPPPVVVHVRPDDPGYGGREVDMEDE